MAIWIFPTGTSFDFIESSVAVLEIIGFNPSGLLNKGFFDDGRAILSYGVRMTSYCEGLITRLFNRVFQRLAQTTASNRPFCERLTAVNYLIIRVF